MREINRLSVQQWLRSAISDSQQPISPIGFLFLKLPPPPCAVLLVYIYIYIYIYIYVRFIFANVRSQNLPSGECVLRGIAWWYHGCHRRVGGGSGNQAKTRRGQWQGREWGWLCPWNRQVNPFGPWHGHPSLSTSEAVGARYKEPVNPAVPINNDRPAIMDSSEPLAPIVLGGNFFPNA